MKNEERIDRARSAMCGVYEPDSDEALTDILADLIHLAAHQDWDFEDSLRMARVHVEAELADDTDTKTGHVLIAMLSLPVKENGRVDTQYGDKTPAGLTRTIQRVLIAKGPL